MEDPSFTLLAFLLAPKLIDTVNDDVAFALLAMPCFVGHCPELIFKLDRAHSLTPNNLLGISVIIYPVT